MTKALANSAGKRFFGIHMYPGVAEYREPGKDAYRVFLNEATIRDMDASFEGRPVYVDHVDGVEQNLDAMRRDADGVVVRSFYNESDGKHWVEFIVLSERGLQAVASGMRLSNAYVLRGTAQGGQWNGVDFQRQVTGAEYEHLALVRHPRYAESVILTPEQFKKYNEDKVAEIKRLSNSNGDEPMFFKRAKVENAVDLADTYVALKSGRELTIKALINEADKAEDKEKPMVANDNHLVDVGGNTMSVGDLKTKHSEMCNELDELKKKYVGDKDEEEKKANALKAAEAEAAAKAAKAAEASKASDAAKSAQAEADRAAAQRLANAQANSSNGTSSAAPTIELTSDRMARGKALFG